MSIQPIFAGSFLLPSQQLQEAFKSASDVPKPSSVSIDAGPTLGNILAGKGNDFLSPNSLEKTTDHFSSTITPVGGDTLITQVAPADPLGQNPNSIHVLNATISGLSNIQNPTFGLNLSPRANSNPFNWTDPTALDIALGTTFSSSLISGLPFFPGFAGINGDGSIPGVAPSAPSGVPSAAVAHAPVSASPAAVTASSPTSAVVVNTLTGSPTAAIATNMITGSAAPATYPTSSGLIYPVTMQSAYPASSTSINAYISTTYTSSISSAYASPAPSSQNNAYPVLYAGTTTPTPAIVTNNSTYGATYGTGRQTYATSINYGNPASTLSVPQPSQAYLTSQANQQQSSALASFMNTSIQLYAQQQTASAKTTSSTASAYPTSPTPAPTPQYGTYLTSQTAYAPTPAPTPQYGTYLTNQAAYTPTPAPTPQYGTYLTSQTAYTPTPPQAYGTYLMNTSAYTPTPTPTYGTPLMSSNPYSASQKPVSTSSTTGNLWLLLAIPVLINSPGASTQSNASPYLIQNSTGQNISQNAQQSAPSVYASS